MTKKDDLDAYIDGREKREPGLKACIEKAVSAKAPVQYILVRKDLPIFTQMVNVGHAAGESIVEAPIDRRTVIRLLHVENEEELLLFDTLLIGKGFSPTLVREPDPPWNNQAMALALEPLTERVNALRKIFFKLEKAQ